MDGTTWDAELQAVRRKVADVAGVWPCGAVDVITMLCEFGVVFNPIVIFLCWDSPDRNRYFPLCLTVGVYLASFPPV